MMAGRCWTPLNELAKLSRFLGRQFWCRQSTASFLPWMWDVGRWLKTWSAETRSESGKETRLVLKSAWLCWFWRQGWRTMETSQEACCWIDSRDAHSWCWGLSVGYEFRDFWGGGEGRGHVGKRKQMSHKSQWICRQSELKKTKISRPLDIKRNGIMY